ncbi:MAG: hypothetical protein OMM_04998 [Candidatus Magnetoglobus multicellularis str. Araruama]|uniref:Gingipain domain-containing protein n=1 Tax=Candidatus Magnetoglobus multicellularis str. Araruama TaxID=890399 RepID=A0A1V1NYY1_9BACT|nr:MAG: hypothetical protein OMM_04998 [Candidatus Magnetoglobus multicellularis str. Araruama]
MNYSPAGASPDRNKTRQQSQTVFQKLNLYIAKNGMYRLSYEALMAYQFPIKNQPHQYLQLWHRKKQIPLDIHSQTTYFQPGDHILFYGLAQEDAYTNINVYQLCWGDNQGLRMQYISAPPDDRYIFVTNAFKTVRFESNVSDHFWPNTPGAPDTDFVFWYLLNTPDSFSTTFDLPHLSKTAMTIPESYIRIAFQEKTNSFHHITIGINGHKIYEKSSHQDSQFFVEKSIDTSMLSAESNTLTIQTDLDANEFSDQLFVNLFTVRYPQSLVTHTDTSIIEMDQSGQNVSIQGFTSEQVFLYDISTPDLPKRMIAPYISKANNDYYVQFYNGAANKIYVSTDSAMKQPDMRMTHTDSLKSTDNRADYIIITPQGFMQAVAPLSSYYQNRGMRVSLVSPDMIIDEFSGGIVTPQAINDFLTYAYHHWETAPSYVLMIGDSNLDYLDLFQTGKQNAVPVYVTYLDGVGLVPDDNHYVCTDGDDIIPDMTIGRLPAKNCNDVEKQVRKRLNYCKSYETASQQTLFISDNHSQDVFEKICQNAMGYLSNQMAQELLIFRGQDNVDEFTQKIISTLNQGTLIATYMGHGSIDNWGGEHLFCSSDVHLITPGSALTFYLSLNCLSGFFALPDRYCLAQQLILSENKGAIGVIAPSGLAQVWEIDLLAQSLFSLLQSNPHMPVGDLFVGAKVKAYGKGMRASSVQMFNLTGDPLVQLNIHHTKLSGDLDTDGDLTLKDVLMMFEYLGRNKDNIKPF